MYEGTPTDERGSKNTKSTFKGDTKYDRTIEYE